MKLLMLAAIAAAALTTGAALGATDQQTAMKTCSNKWTSMTATERGDTKRTDFMSKCLKAGGAAAAAPTMAMKPTAAGSMAMTAKPAAGAMAKPAAAGGGQAKCKDGKTVTYKDRRGTCSGHGGVATWL